jgi:hypothetical protein
MQVRSEFGVHLLNPEGISKAQKIATILSNTLDALEDLCGKDGREMAVVRTKMEEAGFFAKKAMACRSENQQ